MEMYFHFEATLRPDPRKQTKLYATNYSFDDADTELARFEARETLLLFDDKKSPLKRAQRTPSSNIERLTIARSDQPLSMHMIDERLRPDFFLMARKGGPGGDAVPGRVPRGQIVREFFQNRWVGDWPPEGKPIGVVKSSVDEGPVSAADDLALDRHRRVFLVRGHNERAASAVTQLLNSADIHVIGWQEAVAATVNETGSGTPYTLDVVRTGMKRAHATVVLFTPDDLACLDPRLSIGGTTKQQPVAGRPRQNVVLEAGMALALDDHHTIIVEVGAIADISDLAGKYPVRLEGEPNQRLAFLQRLEEIGCAVNMRGDWLKAGDFKAALLPDVEFRIEPSSIRFE